MFLGCKCKCTNIQYRTMAGYKQSKAITKQNKAKQANQSIK